MQCCFNFNFVQLQLLEALIITSNFYKRAERPKGEWSWVMPSAPSGFNHLWNKAGFANRVGASEAGPEGAGASGFG